MYSSEDLEKYYFQYKTEALPHGVSIQEFCVRNKVPYNFFSIWFKDTRKQIVEVTVDGSPSEEGETSAAQSHPRQQYSSGSPVRMLVIIQMSNGIHLARRT